MVSNVDNIRPQEKAMMIIGAVMQQETFKDASNG